MKIIKGVDAVKMNVVDRCTRLQARGEEKKRRGRERLEVQWYLAAAKQGNEGEEFHSARLHYGVQGRSQGIAGTPINYARGRPTPVRRNRGFRLAHQSLRLDSIPLQLSYRQAYDYQLVRSIPSPVSHHLPWSLLVIQTPSSRLD